jgi:hypothetical protein
LRKWPYPIFMIRDPFVEWVELRGFEEVEEGNYSIINHEYEVIYNKLWYFKYSIFINRKTNKNSYQKV